MMVERLLDVVVTVLSVIWVLVSACIVRGKLMTLWWRIGLILGSEQEGRKEFNGSR